VPPLWKDGVAVCIGGGPSIKKKQINAVAEAHRQGKCYAIAINNSYQIAPWADVVYGCDRIWWQWHEDEVQHHQGLKLTISRNAALKYDWVTWIEGEATSNGLSKRSNYIVSGRIGGYQAINLAVNFGATKILLIGYDMRNINGASHWHGDHPNRQRPYWGTRIKHFKNMLPDLEERNIKVINCSQGSALDAFPMGDLDEELS